MIVSNVAGSPVDIYVAGARVESFFPMGPLVLGSGLNFTVDGDKIREIIDESSKKLIGYVLANRDNFSKTLETRLSGSGLATKRRLFF